MGKMPLYRLWVPYGSPPEEVAKIVRAVRKINQETWGQVAIEREPAIPDGTLEARVRFLVAVSEAVCGLYTREVREEIVRRHLEAAAEWGWK